ncbi:unnamed protein product, partial [Urochloa humidicola]
PPISVPSSPPIALEWQQRAGREPVLPHPPPNSFGQRHGPEAHSLPTPASTARSSTWGASATASRSGMRLSGWRRQESHKVQPEPREACEPAPTHCRCGSHHHAMVPAGTRPSSIDGESLTLWVLAGGLQQRRALYQPRLPPCLQGSTVREEYDDAATTIDPNCAHVVTQAFPNTFGQPLISFVAPAAVERPLPPPP